MTMIVLGSFPDCNFLIADRVSYYHPNNDPNWQTFGLKNDKIRKFVDFEGYFTCTGDRLVFEQLDNFAYVNRITSFNDEKTRIEFIADFNRARKVQNISSAVSYSAGIFICTAEYVTMWEVKFDRDKNEYSNGSFQYVIPGQERFISYFGKVRITNEGIPVNRGNVIPYYAFCLNHLLTDPSNTIIKNGLEVTDFILDEVDYALFLLPEGTSTLGNHKL